MVQEKTNVAPSSTSGHYVKGAQVIVLDKINETFHVKGKSVLETQNHTTLAMESENLITCQAVYNPFAKMYERSRD